MRKKKDIYHSTDLSLLNGLINNLPMALFAKDYSELPGRFVNWNTYAESLWGISYDQVIGKSDFDLFPEEQARFFQEKDLETLEAGKTVFIEEESVSSPNGEKIVQTWKIPVVGHNGKGRYLMGICLDMTDHKSLETKLALERAKNIQASKLSSLGEMAAGMAHEINNPLAIIDGEIELLRASYGQKDMPFPVFSRAANTISKNIARISKIIRGLRKFSRDDTETERKPVNLESVIQDTLDLCAARSISLGIPISMSGSPVETTIYASDIQISQILVNLINNSIHAVGSMGNTKKWISIGIAQTSNWVEISITDSGQGIDKELQTKMFEPFFTTKPAGEGTGIGLSICRAIAVDHGGSLSLDTHSPNTKFVLKLPAHHAKVPKSA